MRYARIAVVALAALLAVSGPAFAQVAQSGVSAVTSSAAAAASEGGRATAVSVGVSSVTNNAVSLSGGTGAPLAAGGAGGAGGNSGGQSVSVNTPIQDRIPGLAVAPGLAAGGTGICLGSVSFGLSGPMAGLSFGTTKIDKGCETRNNAVILYNMGHPTAAAYLLAKQPEVQDALDYESKTGKYKAAALPVVLPVALAGPSQVGAPTIAPLYTAVSADVVCTGNDLKVQAGNGQYFCRAR